MPSYFPPRRSTPVSEAQDQEALATQVMQQQADQQDFITKQRREQERQRQQADDAAKEAARAQKAEIARHKKAGVMTETDAAGNEAIKRHEDGAPMFEAGFQGEPTVKDGKGTAKYRDARGNHYDVPLKSIRSEQEGGQTYYAFDSKDDSGQIQTHRQPAGTKPLFNIDKTTGQRIADVTDAATGSVTPAIVGTDPAAASQAAITKRKDALQLRQNEIGGQAEELRLQQNAKEVEFAPIKEKHDAAKAELDKITKAKVQYAKNDEEGLVAVTTLGDGTEYRTPVDTKDPKEVSKANAWLEQRNRVQADYEAAKAAHDPAKEELHSMDKQRADLALKLYHEKKRANAEIQRMEEAAKAGQPVYLPEWQKRALSLVTQPRTQDVSTVADLEDAQHPLAEDVKQVALPSAGAINAALEAGMVSPRSPLALTRDTDTRGMQEAATSASLTDTLTAGLAQNRPVTVADKKAAHELAVKSLGMSPDGVDVSEQKPEGHYELSRKGELFAYLDPQQKRLMLLDTPTTLGGKGAEIIANASQDGVPVYMHSAEQPYTAREVHDLIASGVDASMSAGGNEEQASANLAKVGLSPDGIREKVMAGKLSVQDGKMLNEKLNGAKQVNTTEAAFKNGFGKFLVETPLMAEKYRNGSHEQKAEVVNFYADRFAAQAAAGVVLDRSVLARRREELLAGADDRGAVSKGLAYTGGAIKNGVASLAGIGYWLLRAPDRAIRLVGGTDDEATNLIWNQSRDLAQRLTGEAAPWNKDATPMSRTLGDVQAWADRADFVDELPDALAEQLADEAFTQYHGFSPESAADVDTTRDTFNVKKNPQLRPLLEQYLKTGNAATFQSMFTMLKANARERDTQIAVQKYVERPRTATPAAAVARANLLGIKLDDTKASAALNLAGQLENAKEPKQYQALLKQAAGVLGLEKPEHAALALAEIARQETTDPDSFTGSFRGASVAGIEEMGTEVASDLALAALSSTVIGAPEAVALKGAQIAAKQGIRASMKGAFTRLVTHNLDNLANRSSTFATIRETIGRGRAALGRDLRALGEDFAAAGIQKPKFGAPLTTGQKVANFAVGTGKATLAGAPIEAFEEGLTALLSNDPSAANIGDSMLQGALGVGGITPAFAGVQGIRNAYAARGQLAQWEKIQSDYIASINEVMGKEPGFKPLTTADFDAWQGLQESPQHREAAAEYAAARNDYNTLFEEGALIAAGNAAVAITPELIAAKARLEAATANLAGISQIAFTAMDELRGIPENERVIYTAAAKAAAGATDYTEAEAKALMQQSGANAVTFQQATPLPAGVQGPVPVNTLADAPNVTQAAPGVIRLPDGVRLDVPQPLMDMLAAKAPSMVQLTRGTAPATNQAPAGWQGMNKPGGQPSATPTNATPPGAKTKPAPANPTPAPAPATVAPELSKPWEQFGAVEVLPDGQIRVTTNTAEKNAAVEAELKHQGINWNARGQTSGNNGDVFTLTFRPKAKQKAPKTQPAPAKQLPAKAIESIARTAIGRVTGKSAKLKALIKESKTGLKRPTGGFWMRDDGTIAFHLPTLIADLSGLGLDNAAIGKRVEYLLDEEIRHAANMEAARRLFEAERQAGRTLRGMAFESWRDAWYGDIWNNHFTEEMRAKVKEAYGDTLPTADWMRAMEGLRMLDQLRATGSITEAVLRALDAVIAALRDFLDLVTAGGKKVIEDEINAMQGVLAEYGYERGTVKPDAKKKPAKAKANKEAASAPKSSTQLTLSPADAKPILDFGATIPKDELFDSIDPEWSDGALETEPHVTVLYGLTKHEAAPVAKAIKDHGPVTVTLGKLSIFENDQYDVLKVDVEGPELRALNAKLTKLPHESSFPDYKPHMTIAYLKKGEGKKYVGDARFEGQTITFNTMTFSPPSELRGKLGKPELPLTGQTSKPANPAPETSTSGTNLSKSPETAPESALSNPDMSKGAADGLPPVEKASRFSDTAKEEARQQFKDLLSSAPATVDKSSDEGQSSTHELGIDSPAQLASYDELPDQSLDREELTALTTLRERFGSGVIAAHPRQPLLTPAQTPREKESRRGALSGFQKLSAELQAVFGKRVLFVKRRGKPLPDNAYNVGTSRNVLAVDIDAVEPVSYLVGHELGHAIEAQSPALYRALSAALLEMAGDTTAYRARLTALGYKESELDAEIINDFIGSQFMEPAFWRDLAGRDKNLFERMAEAAVRFIQSILRKAAVLSRDVRPLFAGIDKARALLVEVLTTYATDAKFPQMGSLAGELSKSTGKAKQLPIPPEKLPGFIKLAQTLIGEGVRTPQDLAAFLEETFPGGKARLFSQALWNAVSMVDPALTGQHDWQAIYAELDTPADEAPASEFGDANDPVRELILSPDNRAKKAQAMKKLAEERGETLKQTQEYVESRLVQIADQVAREDWRTPQDRFDELVGIYNKQPLFSARTSTSMENQAYSTPAPLAFAVRHMTGVTPQTSVYDATAGNGMLEIGADLQNSVANEIDETRLEGLRRLGVGTITTRDATSPVGAFQNRSKAQVVHLNPPFGGIPNVNFDGYGIRKLEHIISLHALREGMADNGTAAIILGATMNNQEQAKGAQWVFENYLYAHYNVVDNFEVSGELYSSQGAKWPVRILVIAGKKAVPTRNRDLAPKTVDRLETWPDVWSRAERTRYEVERQRQTLGTAGQTSAPVGDTAGQAGTNDTRPIPVGQRPTAATSSGGGRPGGNSGGKSPAVGQSGTGSSGLASNGTAGQSQDTGTVDQPASSGGKPSARVEAGGRRGDSGQKTSGTRGAGTSASADLAGTNKPDARAVTRNKATATATQVPYDPSSTGTPFETLVPRGISESLQKALAEIVANRGPIDKYVADQLDMSVADLHKAMAAEQIDGVAMAIYQMETGGALIIGDETGIGKGRQAASLIRFAILKGKIPVFFTKDPKLFSDMWGDLKDIGTTVTGPNAAASDMSVRPLILGDSEKAQIKTPDNVVVLKPASNARQSTIFAAARENGFASTGHNAIFATYSQIRDPNARQEFLEWLAANDDVIVVLDEAHESAGDGETSMQAAFMMGGTVKRGKGSTKTEITKSGLLNGPGAMHPRGGVLYLSATFAKRADNMPVYYRTDLRKGADKFEQIVTAMEKGGVALQQAITEALAESGQYTRRERDFTGISYNMKRVTVADEAELVRQVDAVTSVLSAIAAFSKVIKAAVVDSTARTDSQTSMTDFASIVHNQVSQLLLAAKADAVVDEVVEAHKRGEKPIVALMNTMESFLGQYVEDMGIKPGQPIKLNWASLLEYALSRTLRASEKLPNGDTEIYTINPAEHGLGKAYQRVLSAARAVNVAFPVSPIDYIIQKARAGGVEVGELTGRESGIDYTNFATGEGTYRKFKRADKNTLVNTFNSGALTGLLLNASGSTGLSIHASTKFKDQKPRHMIIAQPALDINVFIQTLGRIKRTGIVLMGRYPDGSAYGARYSHLTLPLNSELRPAIMAARKMKSLNANTTGESDSAVKIEAEDLMNRFGNLVVAEYLSRNPDLQDDLNLEIEEREDGTVVVPQDIARKFTGRMALQPNARQGEAYGEIIADYRRAIEQAKVTGDYDLEIIIHEDWDATKAASERIVAGSDESSIFTSSVNVEAWDMTDTRPTPSGADMQAEFLKENGSQQQLDARWQTFSRNVDERLDGLEQRLRQRLAEANAQLAGMATDDPGHKDASRNVSSLERQLSQVSVKKARWRDTQRRLDDIIDEAGRPVTLENAETQEMDHGMMTQIKFPDISGQLRIAPSAFKMTYLLNRPGGRIYPTLAQFKQDGYTQARSQYSLEDMTGDNGGRRERRTILVGSPIRAYGATGGKGKVVRFKARDGSLVTGLMMPRSWNISNLADDPRKELADPAAVDRYMRDLGWSPGYVESGDSVRIHASNGTLRITAPSARRTGGDIFLDEELRSIVGDFFKNGQRMTARIDSIADVARVAARVTQLTGKRFKGQDMERVRRANGVPEDAGNAAVTARPQSAVRQEATQRWNRFIDEGGTVDQLASAPVRSTMPRDRAERIVANLTPKEQAGKLNPKEREALAEARGVVADSALASAPVRSPVSHSAALSQAAATLRGEGPRIAPGLNSLFNPQAKRPATGERGLFDMPKAATVDVTNILRAYRAVQSGTSSAFVPIRAVFERMKAAHPEITPETFMAEIRAADERGDIMVEAPERPETIQQAGPFVVRNALGVPSTNMAALEQGTLASAPAKREKTNVEDAIARIENFYLDPNDTDNWPEDVKAAYEASPLGRAIEEGDFLAAWNAASDDDKSVVVDDDIENLRAAYAAQAKYSAAFEKVWSQPLNAVLTPAEMAEAQASADPELALIRLRNEKVNAITNTFDEATQEAYAYDIDAAEEWVASDELAEASKAPYLEQVRARIADTIRQIEATGRHKWDAKTETFDAVADDEVPVLYSAPSARRAIMGIANEKDAKLVLDAIADHERREHEADKIAQSLVPLQRQLKEDMPKWMRMRELPENSPERQAMRQQMLALEDQIEGNKATLHKLERSTRHLPNLFVRFGMPPPNGRSQNFLASTRETPRYEKGISTFPTKWEEGRWQIVTSFGSEPTLDFLIGDANRHIYLVTGTVIDEGEDNEPVIGQDYRVLKELSPQEILPPGFDAESWDEEASTWSALYSAPSKQDKVREILESMPPIWRDVLQDQWNGKTIEDIAAARHLSLSAVGNILRMAGGRFQILMDRAATKPTVQVEDGKVKATHGRPDLAMSGNAAVAAIDQRRMRPEEVTHAEMQELANRMFAANAEAAEKLIVRWMDSGTTVLSTDGMPDAIKAIVDDAQARSAAEMLMTAAAKMLVTKKAMAGGNTTQLARLIDLYRNTGTEQARALGMRQDPFDTPEERAAMYLQETLLTPPESLRNEIRRNPANKERILAAWAAKADKIKAELLAEGIDIDATLRELAKEKQLADETIPEPVKPVLARAPKKTRQLVKALLQGLRPSEAIKAAGLTAKAAFAAYQAFRESLNQAGTDAAKAMQDQLLRSAPAGDFAANLGLPDLTEEQWMEAIKADKPLRTTPETEKLKDQRERKKAGGEIDLKNPLSTNKARRAIEERKSNTFDKMSEFWRASILSGPQTHVVNIVSGMTYGAYEASFKKLATGVQADIARMFGMKPDAASLADIPAMLSATLPAIKAAFLDSIAAWKSETRLFDSYALQLTDDNGALFKESFSPALKGKLGTFMRGISFRLMGAADEFVKSFFTRIEVAAQARQIARNEGKTGADMANAIAELMEPGSLAWERALAQAKKITFQTEIGSGVAAVDTIDGLASLISRTKKGDFGKMLKGLSHFTFPFVDTPTNIFKQGVAMSPIGGLLAIIDMARSLHRRKQGNTADAERLYNAARAFDDLANQIVAWGFILGLSQLVKPGDDDEELPYITGTIPWRSTSPGEREIAYRTAPPQSIRIGGQWLSYKRLDPFASALAFTVDAIKEMQSGKPLDEAWGNIGLGMMRNMQDKTFLQGVSDLVNAVQDPERFGTKWATNIAIGFVPNLIRQPIRTGDDVFRENDLPNDMGFWEALGRRVGFGVYPKGWSGGALPDNPVAPMPAFDIWGREASKNTGTGQPGTDWLLRLLSPVDTRDAEHVDPLDRALLRYNMRHDEPFGVAAPTREIQRTIAGKVYKVSLTDAEYTDFARKSGQASRAAIGDQYTGRDLTEADVKNIKKLIEDVHDRFRGIAFMRAVQARGGLNMLANTRK